MTQNIESQLQCFQKYEVDKGPTFIADKFKHKHNLNDFFLKVMD